jgi:hypothetical protein
VKFNNEREIKPGAICEQMLLTPNKPISYFSRLILIPFSSHPPFVFFGLFVAEGIRG